MQLFGSKRGEFNQSLNTEGYIVDQRQSQRTTALFRPALLDAEDFQSFCLVKNISTSGLMATFYAPVRPGQPVTVHFDEATKLEGKVVWHEDARAGIEFLRAIDVTELLVGLSGPALIEGGYRSPRLQIEANATFFVHGESHCIQIKDISQRGAKAGVSSLREGEEGTIVVPGLQPRKAVIRWIKDGSAGFYFIDPIGFSELGQWVLAQYNIAQS